MEGSDPEAAPPDHGPSRAARILVIGCVLALAGAVTGIVLLLSADDQSGSEPVDEARAPAVRTETEATLETKSAAPVQLELRPVEGAEARGSVVVTETAGSDELVIQAQLPPVGVSETYELWLYDTPDNARSLGLQRPDAEGNLTGSGPLPANYMQWPYVDLSHENLNDDDPGHSGESLLRGRLSDLAPPAGR